MLPSPIAYLGEPIDFAHVDDDTALKLRRLLTNHGFTVFSPKTAWRVPYDAVMSSKIQGINIAALRWSDVAVFYYPEQVASVGIPLEIADAGSNNVPIYVLRGTSQQPAARRSAVLSWLLDYNDMHIYGIDQMHELGDALVERFIAWAT